MAAMAPLGMRGEHEARGGVERQFEMPVPDAIILEPQVGCGGAANPKRKTAGDLFGARHFAGNNFKLDHQNQRFFT